MVNPVDLGESDVNVGQLTLIQVDRTAGDADGSALAGEWKVTAIDGATTADTVPTLVFSADGTLGGNTSCNSYSTTYRIDGASLTVDGQIAVTMMACDPASNRQEQAYLTVMNEIVDGGATVEIDGANLTIVTVGGATITATR